MTKTFRICNLCCANCAAKMERAINKVKGVNSATVNFFAQKIIVDIDDDNFDGVMTDVRKVCKKVEPEMSFVS